MESFEQAIIDFKNKELIEYKVNYKKVEVDRLKFLELFPKKEILNMSMDDYVVGKGNNSFCYWIETKLKELGSIGGARPDKQFGVCYEKKNAIYKTIQKWDESLDANIAFGKIKNAINELLKAGEVFDIEAISNNPISEMFKSKILTMYYPEKFFNIFSSKHINYFINKLEISNSANNIEEKRQLLIEFKNKNESLKLFNNYFFMRFLYTWSDPKKIRDIRLLPMSSELEFLNMDYKEVQKQFFMDKLINEKKGEYLFRSSGMSAAEGTLVLFQFDNKIIASGVLLSVGKFDDIKDKFYKGAYYFDVESIKVFEPISVDELSKIDKTFKKFSHVKSKLDNSKYELIMALIKSKEEFKLPEEFNDSDLNKLVEGSKKQIVVNAYERNAKAREKCIKIYGTKCAICGFDFGEVYGEKFEGKIHVHHIKPLNEIDKAYVVNPEKDLIPVCPNCHLILHSKVGGTYTPEEVRAFLE